MVRIKVCRDYVDAAKVAVEAGNEMMMSTPPSTTAATKPSPPAA